MRATIIGLFGLLAACGGAPPRDDAAANRTTTAISDVAAATPVASAPGPRASASPAATPVADARSCRAEIGAAAAARLVAQCRDASPATHPPCNAANSCAMIRDEIARSCKLFAGSDPLPPSLCPASITGTAPTLPSPVNVVSRYYAAITAGDYADAYRLWGNGGRSSGKSLAAFTRGFAETESTAVQPGTPSAPEGAAGSLYVTVPVPSPPERRTAPTSASPDDTCCAASTTFPARRSPIAPGTSTRPRFIRCADAAALAVLQRPSCERNGQCRSVRPLVRAARDYPVGRNFLNIRGTPRAAQATSASSP